MSMHAIRIRSLERLERRDLLAGDLVAGDSNQDSYFDQADLIETFKAAKFDTGEPATWEQGDWSGDGVFNSQDFVDAFQTANYLAGPYEPEATEPLDETEPEPINGGFFAIDDADAILSYDQTTGDIVVTTLDEPMSSVHLLSTDSIFVGTETNDYKISLFDQAHPNKYFRLDLAGFRSIELPGIAKTGMTLAEFAADVAPDGSAVTGEPLRFALATPMAATTEICEAHLAGGAIPGDANMDGTFDSTDLTQIFQAGEFFDDVPGNSDWGDGDWNCDAEFNSGDLVAAFKAGHYVGNALPAIADPPLAQTNDPPSVDVFAAADSQLAADQNSQIALAEHVDRYSIFEHNDRDNRQRNVAVDTIMANIET